MKWRQEDTGSQAVGRHVAPLLSALCSWPRITRLSQISGFR
jgi:hypothetical protein